MTTTICPPPTTSAWWDRATEPAATEDANASTPRRQLRDTSGRNQRRGAGCQPRRRERESKKANDEWKTEDSEQQGKIDLLSRELDVTQREYRLRAAAFYADAGNRLRGSGTWDKEDAQYKQQIAQKQKALDDAKKALDDMKEQARKAGVPAKMRE